MSDQYLIVKRGLYYRPDSRGYTGIREEAGRYDKACAEECARLVDGVSIVCEDEAPEYSTACYPGTKLEHVSKQLQAARERVEELEARRKQDDWNGICSDIAVHLALSDTVLCRETSAEHMKTATDLATDLQIAVEAADVSGYFIGKPEDREQLASANERIAELEGVIEAFREALTPSDDTKVAYWAEVKDVHGGFVSWVAVKEIMGLIKARSALKGGE